MTDLISREKAINTAHSMRKVCDTDDIDDYHDLIVAALNDLPSADVQPRETAEWVYGEKDGADGWYCSKCGFHIPWYYDYYGLDNINFIRDFHTCPHCDAKMLKYTGMEREQNG